MKGELSGPNLSDHFMEHVDARFVSGGWQCQDFLLPYFSDDQMERLISCCVLVFQN